MAIIRGRLANIQQIGSTAAPIYTNPASTKTFISGFTLFNSGAGTEIVRLYYVPASGGSLGTAATANQFIQISLASLETFIYESPADGIVLEALNDSLQAVTTTAATVSVIVHGVKDA